MMKRMVVLLVPLACAALAAVPVLAQAGATARGHYFYVACESEDEVALLRLVEAPGEPARLEVVQRIAVGVLDLEIEGPHGLAVSPEGGSWFVSMAHGRPFGTVYKYSTADNQMVDQTELGLFPATMQVSPLTGFLHVVNFNLHGDHQPSSVSIVDPQDMSEIARITTGVMPHGSRFSPDGSRHYSLAMMSDELFEIDAIELEITRTLNVADPVMAEEKRKQVDEKNKAAEAAAEKAKSDSGRPVHDPHPGASHDDYSVAKPTWVQIHPTEPRAYVACNGSDEVIEVDLDQWRVARRLPTDKGPYNVEVTPDGSRLVVTYKSAASIGVWDLHSGKELARLQTSRAVPHGIAITPDSRFALVSVEGKGAQPGTVDVFDLQQLRRIDSADVGKQAGGIVYWKSEPGSETNRLPGN